MCVLADSMGSIIIYDALCKNNPFLATPYSYANYGSHHGSNEALHETDQSDSDHVIKRPTSSTTTGNLEPIKQVSLSNPDLTITEATPVKSPPDESITPPRQESGTSMKPYQSSLQKPSYRHAVSCPSSRRTSSGSQSSEVPRFDFEVCDLFMLGSPLALVLAYRKMCVQGDSKHSKFKLLNC